MPKPRIITRRSPTFRARFVDQSIAELRRWVRAALGTPWEAYAVRALAARLRRA